MKTIKEVQEYVQKLKAEHQFIKLNLPYYHQYIAWENQDEMLDKILKFMAEV